MRYREIFLSAIIILISLPVLPISAQHVPGTEWKQRETGYFLIIYPESLSEDAAALAMILDDVAEDVTSGLPVSHKKKKWPLVLTDRGIDANGFVGLLPRRSVWYATPGEDFTAVSDWWMLLARHEGRHMAQFDAADQGFTRFLHGLFGEYGWGAGILLGTPDWMLEGDAVVMETLLSEEGRGRDPLFTREMEALISEQPEIDYLRAANPSYKQDIPNHYYLGYAMALWIRNEYGSESLEEIYRTAARIPIPVVGINSGTEKATGKKPGELYEEMAESIRKMIETLDSSVEWTPSIQISSESENSTDRDAVFDAGEAGIYCRRSSIAEASFLVRILPDDSEKKMMRLPRNGRVSMALLPDGNLRVAWDSLRDHPVFLNASVSDITVVDLRTDGRVLSRQTLVSDSRYLYPALSPDGSKVAAVLLPEGGGSRIDIIDSRSGEVLSSLPLNRHTAGYPSWSTDGSRIVFTLRDDAGRSIAEWNNRGEFRELKPPSMETVKRPVYSRDAEMLYYTSNRSGFEDLWMLDISNSDTEAGSEVEPLLLARRPFGIEEPVPTADGQSILILEYDSLKGDSIHKVSLSGNGGTETIRASDLPVEDENPDAAARDQAIRNPEVRDEVIAKGNELFPEEKYSVFGHGLNIHSWGLLPAGSIFATSTLKLFVESADVLGTSELEFGGTLNLIDYTPGAYASFRYRGIRPVLGLTARYAYQQPREASYHQVNVMASAYYPANLSRRGIWNHMLTLGIEGGVQWQAPADSLSTVSEGLFPLTVWSADWYRLRVSSDRSIYPDLGWWLMSLYRRIPFSADTSDALTAQARLYLPGGFRNTSLRLSGAAERRTAGFSPVVDAARGYDWLNPATVVKASADYDFPLAYPDWPIGSLIFIQRFRLGLYSDFAFLGDSNALATAGPWLQQWSSGATLTMDFSAFNQFEDFSIGVRFNWLWQEERATVDLMLMDVALF